MKIIGQGNGDTLIVSIEKAEILKIFGYTSAYQIRNAAGVVHPQCWCVDSEFDISGISDALCGLRTVKDDLIKSLDTIQRSLNDFKRRFAELETIGKITAEPNPGGRPIDRGPSNDNAATSESGLAKLVKPVD